MGEMDREYKVLIYSGQQAKDVPGSMVHMEIFGEREVFYRDAKMLLHALGNAADKTETDYKFRICDGVNEDVCANCEEDEIISVLIHTLRDETYQTSIKEIVYQGDRYTDIEVLESEAGSAGATEDCIQVSAKKNGIPTLVCFLSPEVYGECDEDDEYMYIKYVLSDGIVEVKAKQMYIGAYGCTVCRGEEQLCNTKVHAFLEADGKSLTFSILLNGKLYKKISMDEEQIIFYYTPFNCEKLNTDGFRQGENPEDVIFQNVGGKYLYMPDGRETAERRFGGMTLLPPKMPDLSCMNPNAAHKLCQDYIDAFYAALSRAEEYRTENSGYRFRRTGSGDFLLRASMDDFTVNAKIEPYTPWKGGNRVLPRDYIVNTLNDRYDDFDVMIQIENAVFTSEGREVVLVPKDSALEIEVKDAAGKVLCEGKFAELSKGTFFKDVTLPETIYFNSWWEAFAENIKIYKDIKNAILGYGLHRFITVLEKIEQVSYEEMQSNLYGQDMMPDKDVVSFAVEMKNEFNRTGKIPNIAVIGEAGTGKSTMIKKLADSAFGKEVMVSSPSDLKGAYLGQTQYIVVERLAKAAEKGQVLFIDEAYELMKDKFGREAVAVLLPLMTGDRWQVEASLDKQTISIDFEKGIIQRSREDEETNITPGALPIIWIAGYEEDIRLMISQNQGLFRRFKRVVLKSPTTGELYNNLFKVMERDIRKQNHRWEYREDLRDAMERKYDILRKQFESKSGREKIEEFFRWGSQPQNSKYFANYAGVESFLERCIDGIDFEGDIIDQIGTIITVIKRDIRHQIDIVRRKGENDGSVRFDDSERIEMVYDNKTRFTDLIGCDAQKKYMENIIDMLVKRSEYERFDITVPKGALLLGEPGVGKTFIARAMAGEIQERFKKEAPDKRVGFMSLSGPELTTRPVSFISSIFDTAEEYDECVIFIDEVDAIAKERFQNPHYSHFIELIRQMDGVTGRSNIFLLAATNAYEFLDPAFTRAGRIDKELYFTLPDDPARKELAEKYIEKRSKRMLNFTNSKEEQACINRLAAEVAAITYGYTPKDIENVINTAFVEYYQKRSAQEWKQLPGQKPAFGNAELDCLYKEIYEAVETKNIGEARPIKEEEFSVSENNQSRSAVCIHEVGHALVRILCKCRPFEKITSLPRGNTLGYVTMSRDRTLTKKDYENMIRSAMGGRIAEEIVYGKDNISPGAVSDIRKATSYARFMVEKVGFSDEFKFMSFTETTAGHLGQSRYSCSEAFREQSDQAVSKLLKRLYRETGEMLAGHKDLMIALAEEVFKRDMTGEEFTALYHKKRSIFCRGDKK